MEKYKKFFVAVAAAVLVGLNTFMDVTLPFGAENVVDFIITILAALGVYQFANTPAEPTTPAA